MLSRSHLVIGRASECLCTGHNTLRVQNPALWITSREQS